MLFVTVGQQFRLRDAWSNFPQLWALPTAFIAHFLRFLASTLTDIMVQSEFNSKNWIFAHHSKLCGNKLLRSFLNYSEEMRCGGCAVRLAVPRQQTQTEARTAHVDRFSHVTTATGYFISVTA
jgi:hypothetical protein